jgi:hypothetical protein
MPRIKNLPLASDISTDDLLALYDNTGDITGKATIASVVAAAGGGGGGGTVTTISVVSANGLAGSVATATSTPAVTLSTTVTGIVKGNGTALSAASSGTDYYAPGSTDVVVADGGTGSSTASGARTNLGLGSIATQDASSVTITGGSITGITDLAVADGGTGGSTAAAARTNLVVPSFDIDVASTNGVERIRSSTENYLANSSFEFWNSGTSVAPDAWTLQGDATIARSSSPTVGTYAAAVTFGTANTGELYQAIGVSNLVDYTFSCYVERTSGTGAARLVAQDSNSPFAEYSSYTLPTGAGQQLAMLTVKPTNSGSMRFAIKSGGTTASTWRIDECMYQESKAIATTFQHRMIDDTSTQTIFGTKTHYGPVFYSALFGNTATPQSSDGAALGTASLMWADLFLASGGVINFNNGDVILTHSADTLTMAGGNLSLGTTASLTSGTVELGAASDTTLSRASAGQLAVEGVNVLMNGGALGTPSSATLTNATGLPVSGITASTATALGVGSLELGHASDTTLSRSAAGQLAVEGVDVLTTSNTKTMTNKRVSRRAPAVTQSATPTINTDNTDVAHITGLAQAITSMTTNLSGTPVEGDTLRIDITDNGTARSLTWGASFEASGTVALPTTTVVNVRLDVGFVWNTATTKWRCVATA